MILQNLIVDKDMLEKVKTGLIKAYIFPHYAGQKLLYEIKNTNDLKIFNENVLKNKDKLLTLGQDK